MNNPTHSRDRVSLWIVLTAGLLLLLVAAASRANEYPESAHRTDRFNESTAPRRLSVENVSGDIVVSGGAAFSATADISVRAETEALARKYLDETKIRFRNEGNGEYTLVTEEPGVRVTRQNGHRWSLDIHRDNVRYRVEVRYAITLASEAALDVHTVNGNVSVAGIAGALDATSVNGRIRLGGARHDVRAKSVNGAIEASVAELSRGAAIEANTVNGNIQLELPARAAFAFHGHTMNGDIMSTFPLPPREAAAVDAERMKADRERLRADQERMRKEIRAKERERRHDDSDSDSDVDVDIDLSGLNEGLQELSRELAQLGPQIAAEVSASLNHSYDGTVGGGGAEVRCTTLNGKIAVLAAGTSPGDAKSLIPRRGSHGSWSYAPEPPEPPEAPSVPAPAPTPRPPAVPRPPRPPHGGVSGGVHGGIAGGVRGGVSGGVDLPEGSIVRGDIDGDFSTTLPFGDVQLGKVAGAVRIVTYGGEIRVADAGKGADLSTSGGDIDIEGVRGDLRAMTHGGEVRVGNVTGNAKLETMGGDVDLKSCSGSVIAKTGGGDLRLHRVHGSLHASSGGGNVSCDIVGHEAADGVTISSGAGDVTLVLPANYKASLEIQVSGLDEDSEGIVSEFPELTISRRSHSSRETATGTLNGGGPKVAIRISSGTVHLKKGPPA
jgi:DUF4097 and DUF4098 domain-containing protein YvlB